MAEEEEVVEGADDNLSRKGPSKCFGLGKRASLVRFGGLCKPKDTSRPTPLAQCLCTMQKEMAAKAPPDTSLPQNPRDDRGPDNFPPQGGTLSKTCGVKAQFMGEIVIKKDIPPRPPQCQSRPICQLNYPDFGPVPAFEEPVKETCHCPGPIKHHLAPKCQVPLFPLQPEISEACRRLLRARGPDSSRHHTLCPCMCPPEELEEEEEEEEYEEYDPCCPHGSTMYYYRYINPYSPECFPRGAVYGPSDVGSLPERQEYPPRCPGAWEGPPYQEDILTSPTWARQLEAMHAAEPPVLQPPCNPPAFNPQTEDQRLNTPRYNYASSNSCA